MSAIAFTLDLEPDPVTFDLYGPSDELLARPFDNPASQLVGFVGPSGAPLLSRTAGKRWAEIGRSRSMATARRITSRPEMPMWIRLLA